MKSIIRANIFGFEMALFILVSGCAAPSQRTAPILPLPAFEAVIDSDATMANPVLVIRLKHGYQPENNRIDWGVSSGGNYFRCEPNFKYICSVNLVGQLGIKEAHPDSVSTIEIRASLNNNPASVVRSYRIVNSSFLFSSFRVTEDRASLYTAPSIASRHVGQTTSAGAILVRFNDDPINGFFDVCSASGVRAWVWSTTGIKHLGGVNAKTVLQCGSGAR